jgi:DNA-damage-inducible protein D
MSLALSRSCHVISRYPKFVRQYSKGEYLAKGYEPSWVDLRMRSIFSRKKLVEQWGLRGVDKSSEFRNLTHHLTLATFDMTSKQIKDYKGLTHEPIRDHMSEMELVFTIFGEEASEKLIIEQDLYGYKDLKQGCVLGGEFSKELRLRIERITKSKIMTAGNFLEIKPLEAPFKA